MRKTQRPMLRSIYQIKKRCVRARPESECASSTSSSEITLASETQEEEMELWICWLQRTTHEIEEHMTKMNIEDWVSRQLRLKYRWAEHIARRTDNRWSKVLLEWQPARGPKFGDAGVGRQRGRPKTRWEDCLIDFFAAHRLDSWQMIAKCRTTWEGFEDEFCKQT